MEIWKDIEGYEGLFQISNKGRLKRLASIGKYKKSERILSNTYVDKGNYKRVSLLKEGIYKTFGIHRIVAQHFIANSNNHEYVMHLDNNPLNNSVDNLMWGTPKMNAQQMVADGRHRNQYS